MSNTSRKAPRHMPIQQHRDRKRESKKRGLSHIDAIVADYEEYILECESKGEEVIPFHEFAHWYGILNWWRSER